VVNASNIRKDWDWMQENMLPDSEMENISDETTLLAVQGPDSEKLLQKISSSDLSEIKFYNFVEAEVAGRDVILSRTGYTGEPGFEIYADAEDSEHLWHAIFEAGEDYSVEPIGLGARDTLRLEAGLCLYGNDLTEHTSPIEAGLGWVVKPESGDFIGKDIILAEEESGPQRKRVGFELLDRGIPRHGYNIIFSGRKIGEVTSGNQSPMLDKGIGMGYVEEEFSNPGTTFNVKIRTKEIPAKVVKMPFYKSSHK
jgi:aminomethyltransferase